jgi:hypothetical protein
LPDSGSPERKSGGKLQATRRSLVQGTTNQAPWISYKVWGENLGLINKRKQSGWRMTVLSDKILSLHVFDCRMADDPAMMSLATPTYEETK